jgi:adenylate cyclase
MSQLLSASADFDRAIVRSERIRNQLMLGSLALGMVIVYVNFETVPIKDFLFYGGRDGYIITFRWILFFVTYEALYFLLLRYYRKGRMPLPAGVRLAHLLIETSFPSVLLYYWAAQGVANIVDAPVLYSYFLFIILSVLCLDFRFGLLTGLIAALQYSIVVYLIFHEPFHLFFRPALPETSYYVRASLLLLSGTVAGFVSREVRRTFQSFLITQSEKLRIESLFGQQVSREVLEAIVDETNTVRRLEVTVMALDLRDFTAFAESRTPDEILDYQNKIFSPIIQVINQHQGVVNQILGDGIMATFGTPVANPLHADMAFQAALQILDTLQTLNHTSEIPFTRLGIGLHTGEVVTGNIGTENRKQYSISGLAVITAFRVEQLNKELGTDLLITDPVRTKITLGKARLEPMGEKQLKGFGTPVMVYKVLRYSPDPE